MFASENVLKFLIAVVSLHILYSLWTPIADTTYESVIPSPQKSKSVRLPEVCESVSLFTDPAMTRRVVGTPRPIVSLIYITKRPGGYDFLLHSLAQQEGVTDSNAYELICVDELAGQRARRVMEMANEMGINLSGIVPSKPKSRAYMATKFNIYNAINTGLLMARGEVVTFLMDFAWLPPSYLARTIQFYKDPQHKKSFLSYPEHFFHIHSTMRPAKERVNDPTSLTIFSHNMTKSLMSQLHSKGQGPFGLGYTRPQDLVDDYYHGHPQGFIQQPRPKAKDPGEFWELSFASCPMSCLEEINASEEEFDVGDDCHEVNIRLRCKELGYDLWIDGESVVECMWHKNEIDTETALWNRYQKDTAQSLVLGKEMTEIRRKERTVVSRGHDFDLKKWREADCAARL